MMSTASVTGALAHARPLSTGARRGATAGPAAQRGLGVLAKDASRGAKAAAAAAPGAAAAGAAAARRGVGVAVLGRVHLSGGPTARLGQGVVMRAARGGAGADGAGVEVSR